MMVNTELLVPMTDANQNFSRVARMVDEEGVVVILKNNKPRYFVADFAELADLYTAIQERKRLVDTTASTLIAENLEALMELAK